MPNIKVLFLSFGYMPNGRLEPYRERLIQVFAGAGCEVLAFKTNSFFQEFSHAPKFPGAISYVVNEISKFRPDVVVTINRTGLCREVVDCIGSVPIITLFQDPYYYGTDELLTFNERDLLCFLRPDSAEVEAEIIPFVTKRGASRSNVINLPISLDNFTFFPTGKQRDLDVSFVGSSFGADFTKLLTAVNYNAPVRNILVRVFLEHRRQRIADIPQALRAEGVDFSDDVFFSSVNAHQGYRGLLDAIKNESLSIQGMFDDQINAERRIHHLAALTDFKFEMYGVRDDVWIEQMGIVNPALLGCYQYSPINDPDDLAILYNRSKIGFNISRIAAANKGFSFRVPELIACEALLATEDFSRQPLSLMGFIEGKHFIAYESPQDLKEKCSYYLTHENERASIAKAAKEAITALGPECTLHGGIAHCLNLVGFADLAKRIDRLTRGDMGYANTIMHGDFEGTITEGGQESNPRIIDISRQSAVAPPTEGILQRAKARISRSLSGAHP